MDIFLYLTKKESRNLRNSLMKNLSFRLLNLNSSTTVVADWAQSGYTTSSNDLDVVAVNTHLNQLVSNDLSTLLRQLPDPS